MQASPLPPSFLDTYCQSTSSQGCNALCIIISFLVLWSICLSSSRVYLRKGPEYLTRGTAQVFIPLMRFLLLSFVSSSFLVLLRYSFWIFSFISACLIVRFLHQQKLIVFTCSLSDINSPQVSRTLLSILAVLNNAVVWMVFTPPPTSKSYNLINNHFVTLPKAPIPIGIIITFMFHSFSQFPSKIEALSFFFLSFSFILWSARTA